MAPSGGGNLIKINFDNSQPIYAQIMDGVRKALVRGDLQPGDKLPSQRDLATSLKVNPNTIQRAYRDMELIGLVETLRGQGTFIKQEDEIVESVRTEMINTMVRGFILEMKSLGCDTATIVTTVAHQLDSDYSQNNITEVDPPVEGKGDGRWRS